MKIRSTINHRRSLAEAAAGVLLLALLPASTLVDGELGLASGRTAEAALPDGPAPGPFDERPASVPATLGGETQEAWPDPLRAGGAGDQTRSRGVARAVSAGGGEIPVRALAAYQRAALVMADADATCRVGWPLLAAVGRVESDHGRHGAGRFDAEGVVRPAVYGVALDGSGHTRRIADTDAGALDADTKFDRAVGPMQFLPGTWSAVGVDGDGDGQRNPQDIDDAALAAAVYLCYSGDDLSTAEGQRAALLRYNRSSSYADAVMQVMRSYAAQGFGATFRTPSPEVAAILKGGPAAARPAASADSRAPERGRVRQVGLAQMAEPTQWVPPNAGVGHLFGPEESNEPVLPDPDEVPSGTTETGESESPVPVDGEPAEQPVAGSTGEALPSGAEDEVETDDPAGDPSADQSGEHEDQVGDPVEGHADNQADAQADNQADDQTADQSQPGEPAPEQPAPMPVEDVEAALRELGIDPAAARRLLADPAAMEPALRTCLGLHPEEQPDTTAAGQLDLLTRLLACRS